jgi:FAD/FMN-containing dehydrogenase
MAATFAAGERVRNVYELAAKHDAVVVAGSAQDVGIMGWFTGGGHGPLSSTYGMGADNVLQIQIVTPTGDFLTANACQNPEIFWAIRGGGGGTFGVVTEVTMRA